MTSTSFTLEALAQQLEQEIRQNRLTTLPVAWDQDILYPLYDSLSIRNIPHTIAQIMGLDTVAQYPLDSRLWDNQTPVGEVQRVVLFITDGLGYLWLQDLLDSSDTLHQAVYNLTDGRGPLPITSVIPTSTVNALPTIWTGHTPSAHGMVGSTVFLREIGMLSNILRFRPVVGTHPNEILAQWGIDPVMFAPVAGIAELMAAAGIDTHLILGKDMLNSGLSHILHRGVTHTYPHAGFTDLWLMLQNVLSLTLGQKCFISIYLPAIDSLSHLHGAHNEFLRHEVEYQITHLAHIMNMEDIHDGQTLFMLIADHGHHDVPNAIKLGEDPNTTALMQGVRAVGGASRFTYLYLRDGFKTTAKAIIEDHFADQMTYIEPEAALEAGLFGHDPVYEETLHRLGDLILIPRLNTQIIRPQKRGGSVSMHGGLSDWEMLAPLLWKRL